MIVKDIEKIDIRAELSKIRSANIKEHDRRIQEVYEKIPEIKEIDREISHLSIEEVKNRILKNAASKDLGSDIQALSDRKKLILKNEGFGEDYLEPIYSCKLCNDEGFVDGHTCECARKIKITELYRRSNMQKVFEKENFSTFSLECYSREPDESRGMSPYQNASKILGRAKAFVNNFESSHENILIYGETGLGKTFISNCIAKELLDKAHSVLYLSANELFEQVLSRYIMSKDRTFALAEVYEYVYNSDLLIIDDLGTEVLNSFVRSQLFEIINKRTLSEHSTIITTNLSLSELEDRYSERVMSRIAKDYVLYPLYGEDIRYFRRKNNA